MEVILKIVDGPEKGKEFHFNEADNFLIGRKDPTSKAHLNISPEDRYVSRHHFMIEVRPPNIVIRDQGSTNGTYIRHAYQEEWGERIKEIEVNNGDQIKIGHTILSVAVIQPEPQTFDTLVDLKLKEKPKPVEKQPNPQIVIKKPPSSQEKTVPKQEKEHPLPVEQPSKAKPAEPSKANSNPPVGRTPPVEFTCIRCLGPVSEPPKISASMLPENFMCPSCKAEILAERKQMAEMKAAIRYTCFTCPTDLTQLANQDGRAGELGGVALYLCPECSQKQSQQQLDPIGFYQPLKEIGRGGMGVVYKAIHTKSRRLVAIKQMLPIARADQTQVRRFLREAMINEQLHHKAMVRCFESGLKDVNPFFVQEFVPDGNLNQFIAADDRPRLPPLEIVRLMIDSLEGLEAMHLKGYVHRDLKPENILLRKENGHLQPKLADFGLSKSYERHGGTITREGEACGTIFYMPVEQITDFKNVKPPTDIYAMGVTMYYLLTGRFPLAFPTPSELKRGVRLTRDPVRMILEDTPISIRQRKPDLPVELCKIVDKAIEKEIKDRYQTAEQFRSDLVKYSRNK